MIRLYPDEVDFALDVKKEDIKNVDKVDSVDKGNYIIRIEMNDGKVHEESYNVFPLFGEAEWSKIKSLRNIRYKHILNQILGGNE